MSRARRRDRLVGTLAHPLNRPQFDAAKLPESSVVMVSYSRE